MILPKIMSLDQGPLRLQGVFFVAPPLIGIDAAQNVAQEWGSYMKGQDMTDPRGQHRKDAGDGNRAMIEAAMRANPFAKPKDLIEATGLHRATVSRHLAALRKQFEARADG